MGIILSHCLMKISYKIFKPLFKKIWPKICASRRNRNEIFTLAFSQVLEGLQKQECSSQEVVLLNNDDSNKANPNNNPDLQNVLKDALHSTLFADKTILSASYNGLKQLYKRKLLLNEIPVVEGMKQIVGGLKRVAEKYNSDSEPLYLLCEADANPLLLSPKPELHSNAETDLLTHNKCLQPYDSKLTAVRTLDNENALRVTGATLIEVGSEIAGSILLPNVLNNVADHFASRKNMNLKKILQSDLFTTDLPQIFDVMSSGNSRLLKLHDKIDKKRIKTKLFDL